MGPWGASLREEGPSASNVQEGAELARRENIDFILAVGGGSVIDCCKIVSVQAKTDEDVWTMEFAERRMPSTGIPMGAVVTIFGTGAEMNNGAVITNEETKQKNGMLGSFHGFAVLDPAYTLSAPMKQALSGAFDMLSHSMETYFGKPYDNNLSDRIALTNMRCIIDNTRAMIADPEDLAPRGELFWASAMAENGILKIGKATAFQAHMIERQLGAYTDCNHGFGLAVIHPAMYCRMWEGAPEQFARFATEVWGVDAAGRTVEELAQAGIDALEAFIKEIGLPTTLAEIGIAGEGTDEMLRAVADSTIVIPTAPKVLDADAIYEILQECR